MTISFSKRNLFLKESYADSHRNKTEAGASSLTSHKCNFKLWYLKFLYAIQRPTVYILSASRHEVLSVFPSSHLSDNVLCLNNFSRLSVSICHWFHCVAYFCTLSSNSALYLEVQVKIL